MNTILASAAIAASVATAGAISLPESELQVSGRAGVQAQPAGRARVGTAADSALSAVLGADIPLETETHVEARTDIGAQVRRGQAAHVDASADVNAHVPWYQLLIARVTAAVRVTVR